MAEHDVLISLEGICKYFRVTGGTLKAVDNITLDIHRGETFGLVGESGCGKSTLGRVVMGIYTPTAGSLTYDGQKGPDHLPGPLCLPGPPHDGGLHHRGGHDHP